jgi:MATE family multidrug resistance protein
LFVDALNLCGLLASPLILMFCVFAGVAVGAGWQLPIAFANISCYYLVGIPVGVLFGFKLKLGALVS